MQPAEAFKLPFQQLKEDRREASHPERSSISVRGSSVTAMQRHAIDIEEGLREKAVEMRYRKGASAKSCLQSIGIEGAGEWHCTNGPQRIGGKESVYGFGLVLNRYTSTRTMSLRT